MYKISIKNFAIRKISDELKISKNDSILFIITIVAFELVNKTNSFKKTPLAVCDQRVNGDYIKNKK